MFQFKEKQQKIPDWTGLNGIVCKQDIPGKSIVGYCHVNDASLTKLSRVFTLLRKSVAMEKDIDVQDIMVVLDLSTYAKAVEVRWQKQEELNRVAIRLGAFHAVCTFIAVIGKRLKCLGLEDILIEPDVVAPGSIKGVTEEKHYNRAVRPHKIVSEAVWRPKCESFDNWLTLTEDPVVNDMELVEAVKRIKSQPCEATLNDLMGMRCFDELFALMKEFSATPKTPLALYWDSYLEMVDLMLCFILASRQGWWSLHLSARRDMLP